MRKLIAVAALIVALLPCSVKAQTTQLTQTAPGPNCNRGGCINTPLSDGELFTWSDTSVSQKLSFRGLNYFMTAHSSGFPTVAVDLSSTAYENNGFAVHTDFVSGCFRCAYKWHDGYLQLNDKYVGSDPYLYGWNGSVNVTSGTGQVGFAEGIVPVPLTINLASSDPSVLQVPSQVTIMANTLWADFTITATAPTATTNNQLGPITVTVAATYPDGTAATMTITVGPLPAPSPPNDSMLRPFYPCGTKQSNCLKPRPVGTCWNGKGASWDARADGMCYAVDSGK